MEKIHFRYKLAKFLIKIFIWITTDFEIEGSENLDPHKAIIAVSNHLGRLDIPLVYYYLKREDVILLVAKKYQKNFFARWFAESLNVVFVDRYNADFHALRITMKRLNAGGIMVIAVEGTRSPTGALIEGKPGAAYMAVKTQKPLVPVVLTGTEDNVVVNRLKHFRRVKVKAVIGKEFTLPAPNGKITEELLQEYTDEIMCRIAAILPPSYRGIYADHPRLKELLSKEQSISKTN